MPKRQSTRSVPSDAVQGENSYVKLRQVSYRLIMEAQSKKDDKNVTQQEGDEYANRLLKEAVVEWNWVDDDGQPIPSPRDENFDLGDLLVNEVEFLLEEITGGIERKN